MKVAIYNDCFTENYKHFGCELVMETFKDQLKRVDCEFVGSVKKDMIRNQQKHISSILDKADLVIINGEGSFHHNRRSDILEVGEKWPSILINTVFQDNKTEKRLKNFKYISCRESFSAAACARQIGKPVDTVPDIIFTNKRLAKLKHKPIKNLVKVRHGSDLNTKNSAEYFMNTLAQYKGVSSISYHALIISIILGQRIAEVIPANTHKNQGLIHDFLSDSNYVKNSRKKVNNLFENIHNF
jgi:isopentenyl phosphate kinase